MIEVTPVKDGVAMLTLDRPDKKNALSIDLRDRVSDALDELAGDEALRCVVVNRVVAAGDVVPAALAVAAEIAEAPREVLVRLKAKALRRAGIEATTATLDL